MCFQSCCQRSVSQIDPTTPWKRGIRVWPRDSSRKQRQRLRPPTQTSLDHVLGPMARGHQQTRSVGRLCILKTQCTAKCGQDRHLCGTFQSRRRMVQKPRAELSRPKSDTCRIHSTGVGVSLPVTTTTASQTKTLRHWLPTLLLLDTRYTNAHSHRDANPPSRRQTRTRT